ncbi:MAG: TIGR03668 family PPOX class F420-dependent oxidoreductase [Chloroflexota bacterium]
MAERAAMTEGGASPLDPGTWRFLSAHRVARLATVDDRGRPHLVPVCFGVADDTIYLPLDEKPKRVPLTRLRRVRNLVARPDVTLLVDDYREEWTELKWLMVRGRASLIEPGSNEHARAVACLREKYPRYRDMAIDVQPVVRVVPTGERHWSWSGDGLADWPGRPPRNLDFDAIIRGRRSVRAFADKPVPRTLVERVLEAARWAPSPHGRLPWRFAVVTTPWLKARLADAMGEEWERQLAMDGQSAEIIAKRKRRSEDRIREAPVCVVVSLYLEDLDRYPDPARQAAEETMAIQSLGAAAQNLLLAAYQNGLDGGWMCAPLFCPDTVRAALDLEPSLTPHALLTLGYAAKDPIRRERLPLETLIVRYD